MQVIFSFVLILISCLCIYLHLLCCVKADDVVTTALCDVPTKSLQCASLGYNISYPFGDVEPCAESDSFLISGCSSGQAYWEAFNQTFSSEDEAPAVTGIYQAGYLNLINLTWNKPLWEDPNTCNMLSVDELNTSIPGFINLTSFANGSFQLSSYNYILLLNCSKLPPSSTTTVQLSSTICQNYVEQCHLLESTPCAQIVVPTQELMLQDALEKYSCTNFQFLVSAYESTPISSWTQGLVQLFYGSTQCEACYSTGGTCIFDKANTQAFQECYCGNNTFSNTDCHHIRSCQGFKCNTSAKIAVGLFAGGLLATVVIVVALNYHKKTRGFFTKVVAFRSAEISTRQKLSCGPSSLIFRQLDLDRLTERPMEYQYASIVRATKAFRNLLGQGGFGAVYKGTLIDAKDDANVQIAVKVLE